METSANLKSQVTRMGKVTLLDSEKRIIQITSSHSRRSPKHWYYWKNSRGIPFKMFILKNALLWDVLSISIHSKHQFPKTSAYKDFSHRGHLSFCLVEPPFWIPIVDTRLQQRHITDQQSIPPSCGPLHSRQKVSVFWAHGRLPACRRYTGIARQRVYKTRSLLTSR